MSTNQESKLWTVLRVLRGIGATLLLFSASFWIIAHTTLENLKPASLDSAAGVLLTAASLALFVFSSLIAIAAVFGWPGLKNYVDSSVKAAVQPKLDEIQNELRGRTYSNTGFSLGELSLGKDTFQVEREALLDSAIESCWLGYRQLENASDNPRLMALNNWIYYMTFQAGPPRKLSRKDVLSLARELEAVGKKYGAPRLQLTYCRAIACYQEDPTERSQAKLLLKNLAGSPSRYELREADFCSALFEDPRLPYPEG